MAYVVRMPKLGVEMETGVVVAWYVDVGAELSEGDVMAEIESEKSVAEVAAREDGVLRRVFLDVEQEAPPGAPMGIVAGADEDVSDLAAELESNSAAEAAAARGDEGTTGTSAGDAEPGAPGADGTAGTSSREPVAATTPTETVKATPKAKRRARELGVDVAAVHGTGVQDSVTAADVEDAASASDVEDAATASGASRTVRETREFTGMRRTIADRLGQSYRDAVHVTVDREVDVESALATADAAGVSITDVVLQGVSETLTEHPAFNATFDAEAEVHEIYEEHNVGIAVDVDGGLLTPVLTDIRPKSVEDIAAARASLTDRVRDGEFTASDLEGGTFTVSNLGVFGSDSFTPIINPPEVAILGVNRVTERPVRTDRGLEFRRHVTFSLTFDHRVVDGADAARFLTTLDECLSASTVE